MSELPSVLIPKPHVPQTEWLQVSDHRLSTSCGVVERPDHHCGDGLFINLRKTNWMRRFKATYNYWDVVPAWRWWDRKRFFTKDSSAALNRKLLPISWSEGVGLINWYDWPKTRCLVSSQQRLSNGSNLDVDPVDPGASEGFWHDQFQNTAKNSYS